jgi:hypothetical protein
MVVVPDIAVSDAVLTGEAARGFSKETTDLALSANYSQNTMYISA